MCKNIEPIRGFTECEGSCKSGTKYNRLTFNQDKVCDCCSPSDFNKLSVTLKCDDGHTYKKNISVPTECACSACEEKGGKLSSFVKSAIKG